jgi:GR25 family glycosyltransferase involved in LPS biosynthesis
MIKSPIPIYIISLKSRADRRKLLIDELNHIFTTLDQVVVVVDSLLTPRNGAIGCASSHAYALSRFMFETDSQCCLILEDDFQCLDVDYFINSFLNFLKLILASVLDIVISVISVLYSIVLTPNAAANKNNISLSYCTFFFI